MLTVVLASSCNFVCVFDLMVSGWAKGLSHSCDQADDDPLGGRVGA